MAFKGTRIRSSACAPEGLRNAWMPTSLGMSCENAGAPARTANAAMARVLYNAPTVQALYRRLASVQYRGRRKTHDTKRSYRHGVRRRVCDTGRGLHAA